MQKQKQRKKGRKRKAQFSWFHAQSPGAIGERAAIAEKSGRENRGGGGKGKKKESGQRRCGLHSLLAITLLCKKFRPAPKGEESEGPHGEGRKRTTKKAFLLYTKKKEKASDYLQDVMKRQ